MPISVKGPDGKIAQFPDGTDHSVIERAMAAQYPAPAPQTPAPRSLADRLGGAAMDLTVRPVEHAFQDAGDRASQAGSAIGADYQADYGTPRGGREAVMQGVNRGLNVFGIPSNIANDVMGYLTSPFQGVVDTVIGRPAEAVTGGKVSKQAAGNVGAAALPFVGEGAEALSVGRLARELGVGRSTAERVVAQGGQRAAQAAADARAAKPPGIVSRAVSGVTTPVARAVNAASGNRVQSAEQSAVARLTEALKKDGVSPAYIQRALRAYERVGAQAPALLHLAGDNTMAVLRTAATKSGRAREFAQNTADTTRVRLAPDAARAARGLTPDTRTATQLTTDLTEAQSREAQTNYREPYATPFTPEPERLQFVNSSEGQKGLNAAINTATHRAQFPGQFPNAGKEAEQLTSLRQYFRDQAAYEERLRAYEANGGGTFTTPPTGAAADVMNNPRTNPAVRDLLRKEHGWKPDSPPKPPDIPEVSGGAIDRLRIAYRERGRQLYDTNRPLGGAVGQMHKSLNDFLDDIPHMREAQRAYKLKQAEIEGVEHGRGVLTSASEEFLPAVHQMPPEAIRSARVGARQEIENALRGRPGEAQGTLERIAEDADVRDNMTALFGKGTADDFAEQARLRLRRLRKDQKIAPGTGSQTFGRAADQGRISDIPMTKHGLMQKIMGALDNLSTQTEPEARMLMRLGRGAPVERYLNLAKPKPAVPKATLPADTLRQIAILNALGNSGRQAAP